MLELDSSFVFNHVKSKETKISILVIFWGKQIDSVIITKNESFWIPSNPLLNNCLKADSVQMNIWSLINYTKNINQEYGFKEHCSMENCLQLIFVENEGYSISILDKCAVFPIARMLRTLYKPIVDVLNIELEKRYLQSNK